VIVVEASSPACLVLSFVRAASMILHGARIAACNLPANERIGSGPITRPATSGTYTCRDTGSPARSVNVPGADRPAVRVNWSESRLR
jgi:hypothetical protein